MYRTGSKNARTNRKTFVAGICGLKLNIVFVMITLGIVGIQKGQANELITVEQLKELGMQIKTAEDKLHNIKVSAELWVEINSNPKDPCAIWQQTPIYVSSTMWSDGKPGSKIRVDVHNQVLRWERKENPDSFSERSFSNSFDGAKGRSIIKTSGPLGKVAPVMNGVVMTEKPQSLSSSWSRRYTGREFTTNFFTLNSQGSLLSDLFILAEDPNSKVMECFEFSFEKLMGVECIKINTEEAKTQNWSERWWLDPARGFSLLRYEHVRILEDNTEFFIKLIEVQNLREVTEGVWWPTEVTCIVEPLHSDGAYMKLIYRASKVIANDPNFDETVFSPNFPKGYTVDDKVTGETYVVDVNN